MLKFNIRRFYLAQVMILGVLLAPASSVVAEECPNVKLSEVFYDEFYPDLRWDTSNNRVIKWTAEATEIEGAPVSRPFTPEQLEWVRLSFNSWDMASDKITFKEVKKDESPDVKVGLTQLADPNNHGYWTIARSGGFRGTGTVRINSESRFISDKEYFMEVAQSEIGNLLGLGDISDKLPVDSVMMDPDLPPWGSYPLSDYDIGLIRQFYGESTCPSAWPAELKTMKDKIVQAALDAERAKAEAEARAKAEAEARAKAEADLAAKLAAEAAKPTPTPTKKVVAKKTTITCVKGKIVKKVTAVNPKCPAGYKKK